jgi:hypothetical protein
MDRRRTVLQALALASALTVLGGVVVHAGCRTPDPPQRAAAEPAIRPSAAPSLAPSTAPAEPASAPPPLPRPSRIHMGASKSGMIVRPSQAASNNP